MVGPRIAVRSYKQSFGPSPTLAQPTDWWITATSHLRSAKGITMPSTASVASSARTTKPAAPAEKPAASGRRPDAVTLLKADHAEVKKCFKAYQKLVDKDADGGERQALAEQICLLLTVHAQIEEEIFYPAAREVLGEEVDLVDEADVEHASAKDLIAQIQSMQPDDDHYDAKVKVLGEYIDHHVEEEQNEMFPKVKEAGMDTKAVGQQLSERKDELMAGKLSA
jgi:hemerythrin superfamily protein